MVGAVIFSSSMYGCRKQNHLEITQDVEGDSTAEIWERVKDPTDNSQNEEKEI